MREQNEGFSESKLDKKKYKINNTRINIKAKNNSEDNTMKTTKKTHIGDYAVV
jgi:predicted membrane protein